MGGSKTSKFPVRCLQKIENYYLKSLIKFQNIADPENPPLVKDQIFDKGGGVRLGTGLISSAQPIDDFIRVKRVKSVKEIKLPADRSMNYLTITNNLINYHPFKWI